MIQVQVVLYTAISATSYYRFCGSTPFEIERIILSMLAVRTCLYGLPNITLALDRVHVGIMRQRVL